MRTTCCWAVLALTLSLSPVAGAEVEPADKPQEETIKVALKRYKVLAPEYVYKAAADGVQADVYFRDGFAGPAVVPEAMRVVTAGEQRYRVVLAFRTQSRLICLVPSSAEDLLRRLLGLPQDWPLTSAELRRPLVPKEGQQLRVEGTIAGTAVGERYVLVDEVGLGEGRMRGGQREVQLFWQGLPEPCVVSEPGTKRFELPCHHVQDAKANVTVTVRSLSREELINEMAVRAARLEVPPGKPAVARTYGQFTPAAAYQHAGGDERLALDFVDAVNRTVEVEEDISTVTAVRYGREARIRIGAAFRTAAQITCLVPADMGTAVAQVGRMLPGENVRVRGTAAGLVGARKCVVVEYLGFPDQELADFYSRPWMVTVDWPSRRPRTISIWDFGQYDVPGLPCLHQPGRREAIRIVLRQYHELKVTRPAAE
jgi:hypothetical protein